MIHPGEPGRWAELFAAFDALVEMDAQARAERLAEIAATDPAARTVLDGLLEADADSGSGLSNVDAIFGTADSSETIADRDLLKLVGHTVSHFRILEPLAAGGMGVVYRAIDTRLDRPVALKFPLPVQHMDRQVRERFVREARAAATLEHPNICSIYETGETEDGRLFFAMPLYPGETLKARLARAGPLPITDALAIAALIARGLHAAHRAGIVHRDLKPANVMLLPEGELKILDFGVARVADVTLTKSRDTLGTVSYMAPEQVRGDQLDGRADLWSLGVVLFEMLTGKRPFEGPHEIAMAHAILHTKPARPSTLRTGVESGLDELVLRLLEREPVRRPLSAEAVAAEVAAMGTPPGVSRHGRRRFTGFSRRAVVWASILAMGVIAAGTATAWLSRRGPAEGNAGPRIVAVLPFKDLGTDDDSKYLAVALPNEIAASLSRLSAVSVAADSAGAGMVVSGSVQRTGDQVRLEIALFDVARQRLVSTREFRGSVTTLLTLQGKATRELVEELRLDVTPGERAALSAVPTASSEAYDLYLHGRAAELGAAPEDSSRQRVESLQRAETYFARARESDPEFAAPRAGLAAVHLALAQYDDGTARRDQARIEAEAALRLQPGLPEAHEALAAYWSVRGEMLNAIAELERAVGGRPNAAHLYRRIGLDLRQLGRLEEGASALERATRLDPRNPHAHSQAALIYARLRRYRESINHWEHVIAIDPASEFPQIIRGFNYLRMGDVDSLEAAVRRIPPGRDPLGLTTYARYTMHSVRRRHAEALASLDSAKVAIILDGPPTGSGLLYRPVALLRAQTIERLGNDPAAARSAYEAARAVLEDSVAAYPKAPGIRIALGLAYAGLDRRADAVREARTAVDLVPVSEHATASTAFMGGAAEIYAQLGDTDAALELIELLLAMPAGREASVPLLRLDPTFDPLRSDPRFDALLARYSRN
jgi:eukaryotic-like serine/threonine-protein kinase